MSMLAVREPSLYKTDPGVFYTRNGWWTLVVHLSTLVSTRDLQQISEKSAYLHRLCLT